MQSAAVNAKMKIAIRRIGQILPGGIARNKAGVHLPCGRQSRRIPAVRNLNDVNPVEQFRIIVIIL